jgi:hypothetical protein
MREKTNQNPVEVMDDLKQQRIDTSKNIMGIHLQVSQQP